MRDAGRDGPAGQQTVVVASMSTAARGRSGRRFPGGAWRRPWPVAARGGDGVSWLEVGRAASTAARWRRPGSAGSYGVAQVHDSLLMVMSPQRSQIRMVMRQLQDWECCIEAAALPSGPRLGVEPESAARARSAVRMSVQLPWIRWTQVLEWVSRAVRQPGTPRCSRLCEVAAVYPKGPGPGHQQSWPYAPGGRGSHQVDGVVQRVGQRHGVVEPGGGEDPPYRG